MTERGAPVCRGLGEDAQAAFRRLAGAGADPAAYLVEGRHRPAIGYVCSYVPEEVILAAGFHPVRLGARPGPTGPADSCLQSFACSYARACLDGLLASRAAGLAGVVFAYTCDSLRAVAESWRLNAPPGSFFHFLNLPARLDGAGPAAYAASAFARFAEALTLVDGARPLTAGSLDEAFRTTRAIGDALGRLAAVRSSRPDILPGSSFLAAARGATVVERGEVARTLALLAGELEEAARRPDPTGQSARRPRVMVSGGFMETDEPLCLVEEAGADIVADDLCLAGRRLGDRPPGGGDPGDPYTRLAEAYVRRIPCPTKHPPDRRFAFVLREADAAAVDGVVFILQKFCDPHAFDYPHLRDLLEASGRPTLLLEVEQGGVSRGQAATRVEAFVERLQAAGEGRGAV